MRLLAIVGLALVTLVACADDPPCPTSTVPHGETGHIHACMHKGASS